MKLLNVCFLALHLITGCSEKSVTQPSVYSETEGLLISTISKYSNEGIPAFTGPEKVWFIGNEIIKEIGLMDFRIDTNGVQTVKVYITHYAYINYDKKQFSLFHTFSDTAKSFKTYPTLDSLYEYAGGDFFKNSQKPLDSVIAIKALPDTLIKDVLYQRKRYTKRWRNQDYISIVYFRCDRPNSRFSIFKNTIDSCSAVKKIDFMNDGVTLEGGHEKDFIRDSLTAAERKVFEAWRKQMQ